MDEAPKFDAAFQDKVAALTIRDQAFAREVAAYMKPDYLENAIDRNIASVALKFVTDYGALPEPVTLLSIIVKATPAEEHKLYAGRIGALHRVSLAEAGYIKAKVNEFCKRQAMLLLSASLPGLVEKGEYGKAEDLFRQASRIGEEAQATFVNYYDGFERRQQMREDMALGKVVLGV